MTIYSNTIHPYFLHQTECLQVAIFGWWFGTFFIFPNIYIYILLSTVIRVSFLVDRVHSRLDQLVGCARRVDRSTGSTLLRQRRPWIWSFFGSYNDTNTLQKTANDIE